MKEIRNLKGEIVKTEAAYGERWWHLSFESWILLCGIAILAATFFLPIAWFNAAFHFFDIRDWTWRHLLLVVAVAAYAVGCWHIWRSWENYDEDEEHRARSFIFFGLTALVIVFFLVILSLTGRYSIPA